MVFHSPAPILLSISHTHAHILAFTTLFFGVTVKIIAKMKFKKKKLENRNEYFWIYDRPISDGLPQNSLPQKIIRMIYVLKIVICNCNS
jgi:hypothetical protein